MGGEAHDAMAVVEGAKDEYALFEPAIRISNVRNGRNHWAAAGGEHQRVVRLRNTIGRVYQPAVQLDPLDGSPGMKRDAVRAVPGRRVDEDVLRLVAARQHARKKNPVVVAAWFVAEDDHLEAFAATPLDEILEQPCAGHSVADDHQPLTHRVSRFVRRTP